MDSFEEIDNKSSDGENIWDAEDLFDDDGKNEVDYLAPENEAFGEDNSKDGNKDDLKLKTVKKRVVRNPRVLLNFERLKSENGLPALAETFEKFKFRGKHHEKEDLTAIIQNLQHWMCHNLYPGYDFETCMKALEKLGKKRVVQTYMRRMRRENSDFTITKENLTDCIDDNITRNDFNVELDERIEEEC